MSSLDVTLLAALRRDGLLREGHFAFRSGRHSAGLLDRDLLLADPEVASHMGYSLAKMFFTAHIDTVAAPSIWGAGLAQWIGYFLEPKAKIVYATPDDGAITIAEHLIGEVAEKRVLLVDNLVMTGETMRHFLETIEQAGATILGIATLWNAADDEIDGRPVTGLLNSLYRAFPESECPICRYGGSEPESVPY
jgi:orotate phosphoribosyltransferase